jgi:hypothetical protein
MKTPNMTAIAAAQGFKVHPDGSVTTTHLACGCDTSPFLDFQRGILAASGVPVPSSVTDHELQAVNFVNEIADNLRQDDCNGPLVVHSSGAMECHNPTCEGVITATHSMHATDPCNLHHEATMIHPCRRCA